MTIDPYLDPSTGVLSNRLGLTDPAQLEEVEWDISAAVVIRLMTRDLQGSYDLSHLRAFHREIFGWLYP